MPDIYASKYKYNPEQNGRNFLGEWKAFSWKKVWCSDENSLKCFHVDPTGSKSLLVQIMVRN